MQRYAVLCFDIHIIIIILTDSSDEIIEDEVDCIKVITLDPVLPHILGDENGDYHIIMVHETHSIGPSTNFLSILLFNNILEEVGDLYSILICE